MINNKSLSKLTQDISGAINVSIPALIPFIQKVIDPFLLAAPHWGLALYAVIGLYGVYLALRQDELNELLIFIKNHPDEFRQEIVESEEFRKGFIQFFDTYVKERLKKKRKILRNILLGFTTSENKEEFELERLQDTLLRISPEALNLLVFINDEVIPILKKNVEEEMSKMKAHPEDIERLLDGAWARQSVSEVIMKWIYDRYDYNSPIVKKQYGIGSEHNPDLSVKIAAIEHRVSKGKTECWPELLGLGIFRMSVSSGFAGGGGSNYHLTNFGKRFITYITHNHEQ